MKKDFIDEPPAQTVLDVAEFIERTNRGDSRGGDHWGPKKDPLNPPIDWRTADALGW